MKHSIENGKEPEKKEYLFLLLSNQSNKHGSMCMMIIKRVQTKLAITQTNYVVCLPNQPTVQDTLS